LVHEPDLDEVEHAAPYLETAFRLAAGATGVVVDLRANGGGDPGTVALVVDRVVGGGPPRRDHITPVRLARTVQGYLPEAYVVDTVAGANWEGGGVVPDVACPAGDAEDVAVERLLTRERGPRGGS
jgi:hypothetical protein